MIRILHTADWHIGSFPGPEANGNNARFSDICGYLNALTEKARALKPDVIVFSGDMFHAAKVWSDRGLRENSAAISFIRRLRKIAPVILLRGTPNHDSEEQFNSLKSAFNKDDRVHIITEPTAFVLETPAGEIAFCGVPGFDRGYYRAKNPGISKEEENQVFSEALDKLIIGLRAEVPAGIPAVLLAHFTVVGADMESGQTALFGQYEPVIYPTTLNTADYTLSCFGHIHKPQQIEGCKDAFYSGALCRLNFNDEGQQRGFFVHDIDNKTCTRLDSNFCSISGREFLTIRMNDDQIDSWNKSGIFPVDREMALGKIVRVIYSCTDEHNKALNTAAMEEHLKNLGAFWVHEIKPDKIITTVNADILKEAQTPEENLIAYLTEKEVSEENITRIVEAARPIIQEAEALGTESGHGGMFTPIEIEVKNYRNYREERFSYKDIQFCTINGSNGVGKSSLFMDAMLDAIYEEPREGELTGWICNDPDARSGAIKFTFSLGDAVYRITRTRQKNGRATLNLAELVDGEWQDRSREKYRDTQTEIINLLGMDSLTLKACALIMQDQYGLFLQADKTARMNILGNILGLKPYENMEELAAEQATNVNREIRTIEERVTAATASLPDIAVIKAEISAAEERIDHAGKESNEANKTLIQLSEEAAAENAASQGFIQAVSEKNAVQQEITQANSTLTERKGAVHTLSGLISTEPQIMAHVENYNRLLEQEKEYIAAESTAGALREQRDRALADYKLEKARAAETSEKLNNANVLIKSMERSLENADSLTERHNRLIAAQEELPALKALEDKAHDLSYRVMKTEHNMKLSYLQRDTLVGNSKEKLERTRNEVRLLEESGCPVSEKASCKFLASAMAAKKRLPEEEAEYEKRVADEEQNVKELTEEYNKAVEENTRFLTESGYEPEKYLKTLKAIEAFKSTEADYEGLNGLRNCLAAKRAAAEELTATLVEQNNSVADKLTAYEQLAERVKTAELACAGHTALKQQIEAEKSWVAQEKQLPVAKEQLKTAERDIAELEAKLTALNEKLQTATDKMNAAAEECSKYNATQREAKKRAAEEIYNSAQAEIREQSAIVGAKNRQLDEARAAEQKIAADRAEAVRLSESAADYEVLKKAFSQDGIPHNIIRSILPVFEAKATSILSSMSGGRMSVEFVTEKTLKSNSKKEVAALDIIINDADTGRLPYMSRSGGERVKAALSVILALSEIKSTKAGIQLGFLFIDEPPFLDGQGVQAYCDALEAIQRRYSGLKIMAITHDPAMKSRFPQSVDVVKTPEGSKIIY